MRARPAARVLVLDRSGCVLLFRFEHRRGPVAGLSYWATPGGGLDEGESFEDAARREVSEEAGLALDELGPVVGERRFVLQMPDGELVQAYERYFLVRIGDRPALSPAGRTALEIEVMGAHRWWSLEELEQTAETVFPIGLADMLRPFHAG